MSTTTDVELVLQDAEFAYMADAYGEPAMREIARFLLRMGHTPKEAAAIMLSKHLRWAEDLEGRGEGKLTNSAAFKRYYFRTREGLDKQDWILEGVTLARETFADYVTD